MMFNRYSEFPKHQYTITPHDTTALPRLSIIYCGSDGDIIVEDEDGEEVTYTVTAGDILPVLVNKVLNTNTTVSQVIGLY